MLFFSKKQKKILFIYFIIRCIYLFILIFKTNQNIANIVINIEEI